MDDRARSAYAQGRLQARHSRRPQAADWRHVEATQDFDHLLELLRGMTPGRWTRALAPTAGIHEAEPALREAWRAHCEEIAGWYAPQWRPALNWLAWLPWLPLLESLARGQPAPPWLQKDPVLSELATADPARRLEALTDSPLGALAPEWIAGGQLDAGWRRAWRELWPEDASARERKLLTRLDAALAAGTMHRTGTAPTVFANLLETAQRDFNRLFRRAGVGPVAAATWLALGAIDLARVRAAIARTRLFGTGSRA